MTDYFKKTNVFIEGNLHLREPQRQAYMRLKESFKENNFSHKIIVLPTGVGKTGVIGLCPYGISEGRVLIITPGLIIREGISDEFDTRTPFNFWQRRYVITDSSHLPRVYRYAGYKSPNEKRRVLNELYSADIVIANIHKVFNTKSRKTLTEILPNDFFDMIIIDEAHHSAADSWQQTISHFNAKKIVKLTATPFRTDDLKIEGEIIYNFELSDAVRMGYVKNIVAQNFTNQKLKFIVDGKSCSKQEALDLMDNAWVTRSVAYSPECSKTIVDKSIEILNKKRKLGKSFHQIIAVACGIDHAKEIVKLYKDAGLMADYATSDDPVHSEDVIIKFKKGELDVVVNVNMLGEGFDNPNISIAAIFRPFRSLPPYAQFIGRALRKISDGNDDIDNIAHVVYHKELDLDELWRYYTGETKKAKRKQMLERDLHEIDRTRPRDVGDVKTEGKIITEINDFLELNAGSKYAEAIKNEIDKRQKDINDTVNTMKDAGLSTNDIEIFKKGKQQELDSFVTKKRDEKRNELVREELHKRHTQHLIDLSDKFFEETGLNPKGVELPNNETFAFLKNATSNDEYIMKYFNFNLKNHLKRSILEWETYDFRKAENEILPILYENLIDKINKIRGM